MRNEDKKDKQEEAYWIFVDYGRYRCSECGCETHVDELMYKPIYEFCPYCGKQMEKRT